MGRFAGSGHLPAAQPCCSHGKTLSRATSGHVTHSTDIIKTKTMLSFLMQQTQNIPQEHGDPDANQQPALSFAVIIIKKNKTAFGTDCLSHRQTHFTAIRKRAFFESSITKTQRGSLSGQLLLGLGPAPLSDA